MSKINRINKTSSNSLKFRVREFDSEAFQSTMRRLHNLGFDVEFNGDDNTLEISHRTKDDPVNEMLIAKSLIFNHFPEPDDAVPLISKEEWDKKIKAAHGIIEETEESETEITEDEESQEDLEEDNSEESATDVNNAEDETDETAN